MKVSGESGRAYRFFRSIFRRHTFLIQQLTTMAVEEILNHIDQPHFIILETLGDIKIPLFYLSGFESCRTRINGTVRERDPSPAALWGGFIYPEQNLARRLIQLQ
jgi:hypothetical protein